MKIGIQGELGAYSHIAVENLYKNADIKTTISPMFGMYMIFK